MEKVPPSKTHPAAKLRKTKAGETTPKKYIPESQSFPGFESSVPLFLSDVISAKSMSSLIQYLWDYSILLHTYSWQMTSTIS